MNFPIPNEAFDDRFAIVGTTGSGKTFAAGTIVERILDASGRVVIVDPLGVWYGLRLQVDGLNPSRYNPVIFGGAHGDLPITEMSGALIGEAVAGMSESCIVDLSSIGTKNGERRFMLPFLTALYRKTTGEPLHLILDEADMFAPQKLDDKEADAAKLLGMVETIVRRGRIKGFIPFLITQRPAVLNKNVLSQADALIAMKMTGEHDRTAIKGWIEGNGDPALAKELLGSLASKQQGEGLVWIPARGILEHAKFPPKTTFDSSRTPKRGESKRNTVLVPLDLGALQAKLTVITEETKSNDPRALKAEIAKLRKDVIDAEKLRNMPKPDTRTIETMAWQNGHSVGYGKGFSDGMLQISAAIENTIKNELAELANRPLAKPIQVSSPPRAAAPVGSTLDGNISSPDRANPPRNSTQIPPSARKVIDAIHAAYPVAMSFDAAARRAGLSKRSSAYRDYRNHVLNCEEVVRGEDGRFRSSSDYARKDRIVNGNAIELWISKLPPSYGKMLRAINDGCQHKNQIAQEAGISPTSSGLGSGLRELLDLELIIARDGLYSLAEGLV
jgi:uncharacterized protein